MSSPESEWPGFQFHSLDKSALMPRAGTLALSLTSPTHPVSGAPSIRQSGRSKTFRVNGSRRLEY
jgi:hypothetical protein